MSIKAIVNSLLFSMTIPSANAQNPKNYYEEVPKTFIGGLVGGVNFTQVDGDSYKGYKNIGLNTGVVLYAHLFPQVYAGLEILYSQKGAKSNGRQESISKITVITKQNILLNYVEIPVQLLYFDNKRNHFGGGFSYSQLINSKEVIEGTNKSVVYNQDDHPFRKMDINFILSGNAHVYKGLYAGLRFQYSLVSIRSAANVDLEYGREQQFNNVFALRLMYLFN